MSDERIMKWTEWVVVRVLNMPASAGKQWLSELKQLQPELASLATARLTEIDNVVRRFQSEGNLSESA